MEGLAKGMAGAARGSSSVCECGLLSSWVAIGGEEAGEKDLAVGRGRRCRLAETLMALLVSCAGTAGAACDGASSSARVGCASLGEGRPLLRRRRHRRHLSCP